MDTINDNLVARQIAVALACMTDALLGAIYCRAARDPIQDLFLGGFKLAQWPVATGPAAHPLIGRCARARFASGLSLEIEIHATEKTYLHHAGAHISYHCTVKIVRPAPNADAFARHEFERQVSTMGLSELIARAEDQPCTPALALA